jgi:hypothetical protein
MASSVQQQHHQRKRRVRQRSKEAGTQTDSLASRRAAFGPGRRRRWRWREPSAAAGAAQQSDPVAGSAPRRWRQPEPGRRRAACGPIRRKS